MKCFLTAWFLCFVPCVAVTGITCWLLSWYPALMLLCILLALPALTAGLLAALLLQRERQADLEERVRALEERMRSLETGNNLSNPIEQGE